MDHCTICGHDATEKAACDDCRELIADGLLDEEPAHDQFPGEPKEPPVVDLVAALRASVEAAKKRREQAGR